MFSFWPPNYFVVITTSIIFQTQHCTEHESSSLSCTFTLAFTFMFWTFSLSFLSVSIAFCCLLWALSPVPSCWCHCCCSRNVLMWHASVFLLISSFSNAELVVSASDCFSSITTHVFLRAYLPQYITSIAWSCFSVPVCVVHPHISASLFPKDVCLILSTISFKNSRYTWNYFFLHHTLSCDLCAANNVCCNHYNVLFVVTADD